MLRVAVLSRWHPHESRYTPEKNYRILKDIYDHMERKEGSHV